jgi:hypothetical protein
VIDMPMGLDFMANLDEIVLSNIKKGQLLSSMNLDKGQEATIHYDIKFMKDLMRDVYEMYSSGEADKKKFVALFDKHHKKFANDKGNIMERLADTQDDLFQVEEKSVDKNGNITIKLKKLDPTERLKLLNKVTKTLLSKMTKKQLQEMLSEGIRKNNTTEEIKKMSEKLDAKKEAKVEGIKGCYKLVVDDLELMVTL